MLEDEANDLVSIVILVYNKVSIFLLQKCGGKK
jgi:hypothetical protein